MKGLELSRKYYEAYGRDMIHRYFPEYENRIAVGLVGQGSECFGFDDELSTDHDFGPSFCLWLTDEDDQAIGDDLQKHYDRLPDTFLGLASRAISLHGHGRVGVLSISRFYSPQIGQPGVPGTLIDWLRIPESRLATVTNGEVFVDRLGRFSEIRSQLLQFYPEDVRIKKIAARAAVIAQSGQYNFARCMRRGETVAASQALGEFVKNAISMVFLLNRSYTPYYKWMHRAMRSLSILPDVAGMIEELCLTGLVPANWVHQSDLSQMCSLNFEDRQVELIEQICRSVIDELHHQGLSSRDDDFLEAHAVEIQSHIKDDRIRSLHVMEG